MELRQESDGRKLHVHPHDSLHACSFAVCATVQETDGECGCDTGFAALLVAQSVQAPFRWHTHESRVHEAHYPLYGHYDILFGLRVMAETGHLGDPRCDPALDLLEQKRLPDGSWPAESRYYSVSENLKLNADYVDWDGTSKKKMNPWVTADALSVLVSAGRFSP